MRLWPFSASACESDRNRRGISGRAIPLLSRVIPLNSSEIKVKAILSVRYNLRSIWKKAPPYTEWPAVYDGKGGVKFGFPLVLLAGEPSGTKFGSPRVS